MINSRHSLRWCDHCGDYMVICADCGNNCCNGGTKLLANGNECGCVEAYKHQDFYHATSDYANFSDEIVFTDVRGGGGRPFSPIKHKIALRKLIMKKFSIRDTGFWCSICQKMWIKRCAYPTHRR